MRSVALAAAGLVLSAAPVGFGGQAARAAAAVPPSSGPLVVSVAAYGGDAVTSTPIDSAPAASDVTYQVSLSNDSPDAQSSVVVQVFLPSAFALQGGSVVASAGTGSVSGATVTWSMPALAAAASETLTYTERTDAPASLEPDAVSVSATSDQSTVPAPVIATIDVIPVVDLEVAVSDGVDAIAPGSSDIYSITVTNLGPSEAPGVTVTDSTSGGFTALSAVSSIDGTSFEEPGPGQFEWTGVDLPAGTSATFTVSGTLSWSLDAGGAFVSVATVAPTDGQIDLAASSSANDSDLVLALPQAISFSPPLTAVVGQSSTLVASGGGSGNPVVFSVDPASGPGVCAVSGTNGSTLTGEAPGQCVVDADQAGDRTYTSAPTVSASITVEQVPSFTAATPPATATAGQGYSYAFAASGSPVPTFALAPGAPTWLSIDPTSGVLSGVPPAGTASFSFSVAATNAAGTADAGPFSVTVPSATNQKEADVSVTLSCPGTIQVQATTSCVLTVRNRGPATASFVAAGIALPRSVSRIGGSDSAMWFGNDAVWFVGALPPGASSNVSVTFRATAAGSVTVTGAGIALGPDPSYVNNATGAQITVTG